MKMPNPMPFDCTMSQLFCRYCGDPQHLSREEKAQCNIC
jgi:hypothetical protein